MKLGDIVGGYELKWRLGEGAAAQVFLGRHQQTGEDAAVKLLRKDASAEVRRTLLSEARTLARLKHQHVVGIYSLGSDHLIMRYVDGTDLSKRLQSPVSPALARRIVTQIGSGLSHAHRNGVIHRDIKPGEEATERAPRRRSEPAAKCLQPDEDLRGTMFGLPYGCRRPAGPY